MAKTPPPPRKLKSYLDVPAYTPPLVWRVRWRPLDARFAPFVPLSLPESMNDEEVRQDAMRSIYDEAANRGGAWLIAIEAPDATAPRYVGFGPWSSTRIPESLLKVIERKRYAAEERFVDSLGLTPEARRAVALELARSVESFCQNPRSPAALRVFASWLEGRETDENVSLAAGWAHRVAADAVYDRTPGTLALGAARAVNDAGSVFKGTPLNLLSMARYTQGDPYGFVLVERALGIRL